MGAEPQWRSSGHDFESDLANALRISMEAEPQMQPAAQDAITTLPSHLVTRDELASAPEEHKSCCVCREDFQEKDEQRTLPCFHRFHRHCVDQWLERSGTCPICKHRVDA